MLDVANLSSKIQKFFNETANTVARTVGFVERTSKLNGALFVQTLVLGFMDEPEASLTNLVETSSDLGVTITKQGLQERIQQAPPFLKEMFQQSSALFRNDLPLDLALLKQFTAIYLHDSTVIALPEVLQDEFPGCGGDGPDAALKIQLTFEFLRGTFEGTVFQPGRSPDQAYDGHLQVIQPGALHMHDLGFFVLRHFRRIDEHNAYFLSRLDLQTSLFDPDTGEEIDLLAWLRAQHGTHFERECLVGAQEKLHCRVLVVRVPQEVADRRRQKAYERAQRKGRAPTARYLELLNWSVYITNAPATMLTLKQAVVLYTARWQIELMFKLWKSECAVDRVAGRCRERILSELYAKLIGVVVMQFLWAPYRDGERELSAVKVFRIIRHYVPQVIQSIGNLDHLTQILERIVARFAKYGAKDKRQKRLSTYQKLEQVAVALA
jgi:hypothetical protein